LLALLSFVFSAIAQTSCPQLQAPAADPTKLLFTPEQETELGEIVRQQLESDFLVIQDEQVTAYLTRVGNRVASHLPESGLHFQFLLYDQPEIQAFSMPGGRVYVSRKMVAFLRNDDELAGLLGHELGHLVARQQAFEMSREFREVLRVNSLTADEDLYERYNQYLDSVRLKKRKSHPSNEDDKGQKVADLLGIQAVARAGYAPQAFPDLLDRIMETKGKTGGWLSDLFGATRPDSKRLREALKDVANLPSPCIESKGPSRFGEFTQWQAAVLHYNGIGHGEQLTGLVSKKQLENPLRGDIEYFRFSSDGKYLLAQDEGGIYVLTSEPLKFLFRIDAADAQHAQFSPDSRQISFFSSGLRVETWDVDRQEQSSVTDVPVLHGCRQTELSPDAKYLACFSKSLDLSLFNVATGETIFKREKFFDFDGGFTGYAGLFKLLYFLMHPEVATLRFSPDGRYFAASSRTKEEALIDLTTQKKMSIPGSMQTAMEYSFTFLGPDRLVGVDTSKPEKSPILEFPSGKVLDRVPLGGGDLIAASNPKYLLVRPVQDKPVGLFSLEQKKIILSNRLAAYDVWEQVSVSERLNGEIGLYKAGEFTTTNVLELPLGKLANLTTYTASPDLKWFAFSARTRGGIWDLEQNKRAVYVRNFQSVYYGSNDIVYLDFPEFEKVPREMVAMRPATNQSKERPVEKDDDARFFGNVYLRTVHKEKNREGRKNFDLQGLDMVSLAPLWTHTYPKEGPTVAGKPTSGELILVWGAKSEGLRDEMTRDPKLQASWAKQNPGETDFFLEVLNAREGTFAGGAMVHTGKYSFQPEHEEAAGDWLVVTDNRNRVLLYSILNGGLKAKWFGYNPQMSQGGNRLCVSNGRGQLIVYDLKTLRPMREFSFRNRVVADIFSEDGKRLFVLTNDQTTFIFDVSGEAPAAALF
jgi:WD40 repeat protein